MSDSAIPRLAPAVVTADWLVTALTDGVPAAVAHTIREGPTGGSSPWPWQTDGPRLHHWPALRPDVITAPEDVSLAAVIRWAVGQCSPADRAAILTAHAVAETARRRLVDRASRVPPHVVRVTPLDRLADHRWRAARRTLGALVREVLHRGPDQLDLWSAA